MIIAYTMDAGCWYIGFYCNRLLECQVPPKDDRSHSYIMNLCVPGFSFLAFLCFLFLPDYAMRMCCVCFHCLLAHVCRMFSFHSWTKPMLLVM